MQSLQFLQFLATSIKHKAFIFRVGQSLIGLILCFGTLFAQATDEKVLKHQELKEVVADEYSRDSYTLESPFVKVNPFGNNPLVAELRFRSRGKLRVSILVREKDGSFYEQEHNEFVREHRYPVLGLYPNTKNAVTILASTRGGKNYRSELVISTEGLPEDYPSLGNELKVVKRHESRYKKGFYFLMLVKRKLPTGAEFMYSAVDGEGNVRWINTELKGHVLTRTGRGTIFVTLENTANLYHSDSVYEMDDFGQYLKKWSIPSLIHHELKVLPNQNLLLLSNSKDFIEDTVIELDYKTGRVVKEWNLADYVPKTREPLPGFGHLRHKDWAHMNSLDYEADTDTFFVSSRNQSVIVAIDRGSDKLKWISGSWDNWTEKQTPYLLTLLENTSEDEEFVAGATGMGEWHWGQHCVRMLGEGHLLVFDNGRSRSFDINEKLFAFETYSRAVEYKIDESSKTIRQVWEFGKEYGHQLYSSYVSGVHYLEDENAILVNFGGITKDSLGNPTDDSASYNSARLFEVTKDADKTILFELAIRSTDYTKRYGFRVYRAHKYADISF